MTLLTVEEALRQVLAGVQPLPAEPVGLAAARGRVLAEPLVAKRTQPPFDCSAMDGYALRARDAVAGARLDVVGESAAGHVFAGQVEAGQAVRIFTGAPLPAGTDAVLVQELAKRAGDIVIVEAGVRPGQNVRPQGLDFKVGDAAIAAPLLLGARDLALAAAMNHPHLAVRRRPKVAVLATGDEIVAPGQVIGPGQIVASNSYALAAMVEAEGGTVLDLGIAGDDFSALENAFREARAAQADILVTIGGASVGDHDLVQTALTREGMQLGFWRIAMRPGKPMMHGYLGAMRILGLPGNPVSAIVCGILFLVPLVRTMLGRSDVKLTRLRAQFAVDWPANDWREDYLRGTSKFDDASGQTLVTPARLQDSSMVGILQRSDCLIVRPANAPAAIAGDGCQIIDLRAAGL